MCMCKFMSLPKGYPEVYSIDMYVSPNKNPLYNTMYDVLRLPQIVQIYIICSGFPTMHKAA